MVRRIALSKYTEANFLKINFLDDRVRPLFREFLYRISIAGIYVRITSGMRTSEEQDYLYSLGRSRPGNIVTWVNDSNSFHTHGVAIDIAPMIRIGPIEFKAIFTEKYFNQIDRIANEIGIKHPYSSDRPHYQYTGNKTISQLKSGQRVQIPSFESIERPPVLQRAIERMKNDGIIPS